MGLRIFPKSLIIYFCIAITCVVNVTPNSELTPEAEQPAVSVHIKQLGDREYLSPNLIGLQNLARAHLPKALNLINVLEAFREITNHIRYELIVRSIDSSDSEVICHMVIKEKPWLRDYTGEKYKALDYTNCSSYNGENENTSENENKYEPVNYLRRNSDISNNNIFELESHILPKTHTTESIEETSKTPHKLSGDVEDFLDSFFEVQPPERIHTERESANKNNDRREPTYDVLSSETRRKRNVNSEDANRNANPFHQQFGIKSRQLDKSEYGNLETFLERFLQSHDINGHKYRVHKMHHIHNQNKNHDIQKFMAELTSENESEMNCTIKIRPHERNNVKDIELDISCPNFIKTIVESKHFYEKYSKSNGLLSKAEYLFAKFQWKYNKQYSDKEIQQRFSIFRKNLAKIAELNEKEQGTAVYGITEFADMTEYEYRQRTGLWPRNSNNHMQNPLADIPNFKLPNEFDWRKRGAISKVKNQGSCGSCWAFSVTGNIEGLHAVKTGQLEEYSEQELLDCDAADSACMGGLPDSAFKAIEEIGGLELESEYPYKAKKDKCKFNNTMVHVKVKGAIDFPKNETAMALWLMENGPISIGLNANAMQFYHGGISHPWKLLCRPGGIDHGVLIVGFGIKEYPRFNKTLPYWIIKNSWGKSWGEQGYYRLYRGDNSCGVNTMASSAVLA